MTTLMAISLDLQLAGGPFTDLERVGICVCAPFPDRERMRLQDSR
jgi:hypothetical protein